MKEIGKRLAALRGRRSCQEVADAVGVSRSAIAMYEIGQRRPSDEVKVKLAKYYGMGVEDLFYPETGEESKRG